MENTAVDQITDDIPLSEKYPELTEQDHVLSKDMWAGGRERLENEEYIFNIDKSGFVKAEWMKVKYPPAFTKGCLSEPLSNILDHLVKAGGVTVAKVTFDRETGRITMLNDGRGVEVEVHPVAKTWVPERIFGKLMTGSNLKKDPMSITGGTNGVGVKLTNIYSTEFTLETIDNRPHNHKFYFQKWTNHMKDVNEPIIIDLNSPHKLPKERTQPHTKISFIPDYAGVFGFSQLTNEDLDVIEGQIMTQVVLAAVYAKYCKHDKDIVERSNATINNKSRSTKIKSLQAEQTVSFYYNDVKVRLESLMDLAEALDSTAQKFHFIMVPQNNPKSKVAVPLIYNWEICVLIASMKVPQFSIVNGVLGITGGKHIKFIQNNIVNSIKESVSKLLNTKNIAFNESYVLKHITILANCKITGVNWEGQRKDKVELDIRRLSVYSIPNNVISGISGILNNILLESIFDNQGKSDKKSKEKDKIKDLLDKYVPAEWAGTKRSNECFLILPEGDSAEGMVRAGITQKVKVEVAEVAEDANTAKKTRKGKKSKAKKEVDGDVPLLGFERYGILTLGGVIVNVRKLSKLVQTKTGDRYTLAPKLINNKFWQAFTKVTGLDINARYDKTSPTYESELARLNYRGGIIICVDQDHDGLGNIASLILNIFIRFWPNLIDLGYVKRFATPIIRAMPKTGGKVFEFYNMPEYREWLKTHATSSYDIDYIKGLATHDRPSTLRMWRNFHSYLFTYYRTDESERLFEIYFGDDADLRKEVLRTAVIDIPDDLVQSQFNTKMISCDHHLIYEAKSHKYSDLFQKLYNAVDGMNESGRKIFDGCYKKFASSNKKLKVAQLSGFIAEHENYHHGEQNLSDSISGKAFLAVGGVQLPYIIPCSIGFGTRNKGGADTGSPRYIYAKFNKKLTRLLFPSEDRWILEYTFDEGKRGEPKYFVPIIPTVCCESMHIPSNGWDMLIWARDVFSVIKNVRRMINHDKGNECELFPFDYYTKGYKGEIRTIWGAKYSFGKYSYDASTNTIRVTELPLREWNEPYRSRMAEKKDRFVDLVKNKSSDIDVDIEIKLKPGAYEAMREFDDLPWMDGVEKCLELQVRLHESINLMGHDDFIIEFDSLEKVAKYWFNIRKEFYAKRIRREKIVKEIEIIYMENIIRYLKQFDELAINKIEDEELASKKLSEHGYVKFNKTYFNKSKLNPEYTPIDEIENVIYRSDNSSHDYLLDITDRMKLAKYVNEKEVKLAEMKEDLRLFIERAQMGKFPGAQIWLDELSELEKIIQFGFATNWTYGKEDKFEY